MAAVTQIPVVGHPGHAAGRAREDLDAANGHHERRQRRRRRRRRREARLREDPVAVVRDAREGRRVVRVARDPPRDDADLQRLLPVAVRVARAFRVDDERAARVAGARVFLRLGLRANVLRRRVVEVVVALRGVRRLDGAEGALAVRLLLHLERRDLHDVGEARRRARREVVRPHAPPRHRRLHALPRVGEAPVVELYERVLQYLHAADRLGLVVVADALRILGELHQRDVVLVAVGVVVRVHDHLLHLDRVGAVIRVFVVIFPQVVAEHAHVPVVVRVGENPGPLEAVRRREHPPLRDQAAAAAEARGRERRPPRLGEQDLVVVLVRRRVLALDHELAADLLLCAVLGRRGPARRRRARLDGERARDLGGRQVVLRILEDRCAERKRAERGGQRNFHHACDPPR